MAKVTFKGTEFNTVGYLPEKGHKAPHFVLVKPDLTELDIESLKGKNVILNIFPSLDTDVCAASVRKFNEEAAKLKNTEVLAISADLPFAAGRFCTTNGIDNVTPLSVFRDYDFGKQYGVVLSDGPLRGLLSRAVIVLDEHHHVKYAELVSEITHEPNYQRALEALKK